MGPLHLPVLSEGGSHLAVGVAVGGVWAPSPAVTSGVASVLSLGDLTEGLLWLTRTPWRLWVPWSHTGRCWSQAKAGDERPEGPAPSRLNEGAAPAPGSQPWSGFTSKASGETISSSHLLRSSLVHLHTEVSNHVRSPPPHSLPHLEAPSPRGVAPTTAASPLPNDPTPCSNTCAPVIQALLSGFQHLQGVWPWEVGPQPELRAGEGASE